MKQAKSKKRMQYPRKAKPKPAIETGGDDSYSASFTSGYSTLTKNKNRTEWIDR
jgi:hypothetical protein